MSATIQAAGAVVWRKNKDKTEIAIIHRPKYDDWTFPKGKLDTGEELISGAYREILEETGLDIELGPYLGAVEYESFEEAKHVSYWAAKALASSKDFHPNNEVDILEWHDIESARNKLTRDSDKEILEIFIDSPYQATKLIFLRHAKALARSEWQSGDEDRPLDNLGQLQAKRMHAIYQVFGISQIHTSDAVRCYDTVNPMVKGLGIRLEVTGKLSESTYKKDKEKAFDYAKDLIKEDARILLCSHNPILPKMLNRLTKKSDVDADEGKLSPADGWVIHRSGKEIIQIDRIDAPTA